jgi:predicted Zn-ribbon and HTH transcriptional regulator
MTNSTRYVTRKEAIDREIVEPIEAGEATADQYDIDAIADAVLGDYEQGFACIVDHDEFWIAVERYAKACGVSPTHCHECGSTELTAGERCPACDGESN